MCMACFVGSLLLSDIFLYCADEGGLKSLHILDTKHTETSELSRELGPGEAGLLPTC